MQPLLRAALNVLSATKKLSAKEQLGAAKARVAQEAVEAKAKATAEKAAKATAARATKAAAEEAKKQDKPARTKNVPSAEEHTRTEAIFEGRLVRIPRTPPAGTHANCLLLPHPQVFSKDACVPSVPLKPFDFTTNDAIGNLSSSRQASIPRLPSLTASPKATSLSLKADETSLGGPAR